MRDIDFTLQDYASYFNSAQRGQLRILNECGQFDSKGKIIAVARMPRDTSKSPEQMNIRIGNHGNWTHGLLMNKDIIECRLVFNILLNSRFKRDKKRSIAEKFEDTLFDNLVNLVKNNLEKTSMWDCGRINFTERRGKVEAHTFCAYVRVHNKKELALFTETVKQFYTFVYKYSSFSKAKKL